MFPLHGRSMAGLLRPAMRFIQMKSAEQQSQLMQHRARIAVLGRTRLQTG
jgi:hypothetical protein